jgi:hypothetical protein
MIENTGGIGRDVESLGPQEVGHPLNGGPVGR